MNPYPPPDLPIDHTMSIIKEVNMEALLLAIWADVLVVLNSYATAFFALLWDMLLAWFGG